MEPTPDHDPSRGMLHPEPPSQREHLLHVYCALVWLSFGGRVVDPTQISEGSIIIMALSERGEVHVAK